MAEQKLTLYEVYFDTSQHKWRQKDLKTLPASKIEQLRDEERQLKQSVKGRKGIDFVVNLSGTRLRLNE